MLPSFLIFAMMLMLLVSCIVSSNTFYVITTIFAVITMVSVDQLVLILGGTLRHTHFVAIPNSISQKDEAMFGEPPESLRRFPSAEKRVPTCCRRSSLRK